MSVTSKQGRQAAARPVWPWVASGVLLVVGVCGFALAWLDHPAPVRLIEDFARRANAGDRAALDLLGPAAAFDDAPITEREAEARQADFYLRSPKLQVIAVRRGEPDANGKMRSAANRYTLVTRVQGSTPALRVRNDKGEVDAPRRLFIINPDLVVEVSGGKIHGVRAELHRD